MFSGFNNQQKVDKPQQNKLIFNAMHLNFQQSICINARVS